MKFMYNGIKSKNTLYKAYISLGENIYGEEVITVYKRGYSSFPKEIQEEFIVKNDTDIREDYFETDHFVIKPDNKYFIDALNAWIKDTEKSIKRIENRMSKAATKKYLLDGYQNDINWKQKQLERARREYLKCSTAVKE